MKRKKLLVMIICIFFAGIVGGGIFLSDYYPANEQALEALKSDNEVTVSELSDGNYLFEPNEPIAGLIFYPGGKVEHTSYATLMNAYAKQGIQCILVEMPFKLAILDRNAAEGIKEQYPEIEKWYIGGHSLGGAMAASYVAEHTDEFEGLFLLASYSTEDLSASDLRVISLYGAQDQILDLEKYDEYKRHLPVDVTEVIIDGGCHAYFGSYGEQDGDGVPKITPEEQQQMTVKVTVSDIEKE